MSWTAAIDMKQCRRRSCDAVAERNGYCAKHYRFGQMLGDAKHRGKAAPSREDMDTMLAAVTNNGRLVCPTCGREMQWLAPRRGAVRSTQISLQHDRAGTMRFLCLGCNVKHDILPDDDFYGLPSDHKRCCGCREIKPFSAFCMDRSRPSGLKGRCRMCQKQLYEMNRAYWQAWGKKRRAARLAGRD